jgi:hypothetical protein
MLWKCDATSSDSELGSLAGFYIEDGGTSGFKTARKHYCLLVAKEKP